MVPGSAATWRPIEQLSCRLARPMRPIQTVPAPCSLPSCDRTGVRTPVVDYSNCSDPPRPGSWHERQLNCGSRSSTGQHRSAAGSQTVRECASENRLAQNSRRRNAISSRRHAPFQDLCALGRYGLPGRRLHHWVYARAWVCVGTGDDRPSAPIYRWRTRTAAFATVLLWMLQFFW